METTKGQAMWSKWERFCEWNVQNYDEYPKTRGVILTAWVVGAVVGLNWYGQKMAEQQYNAKRSVIR